jgi:hypothetical protein
MQKPNWQVDHHDRLLLRELAHRQDEIAHAPDNVERRRNWIRHNALKPGRPMLLVELGGLTQAGEWDLNADLRCREQWARGVEAGLRATMYQYEHIRDDAVVEPVSHFDEQAIRDDIRQTLQLARNCNVEFAMKDVHTVCGQVGRLRRWVEIAREETEEAAYSSVRTRHARPSSVHNRR